ncbi:MAG: isoleucine--tRNA ligase [Chloroflexi bacterium]|nr:isoleucine--tRNA ligase [Chloroflexota bacterium]
MVSEKKRFEPVTSRVDFPALEEAVLEAWRENDTFGAVDRLRADAQTFVFYEGPPTANGSPGIHHVLSRAFKDVILRYKTMRGFRPVRRGGWDTHGLPVELEIEKELGFSTKSEIERFGIEEFNRRCRESVFRYVKEWEAMTERVGVWLDMDDAYVTSDNSYISTGWWVFKQLWDQGYIYEAYRVTPHCPRCVTSLSSHEVALGYREDTPDPSVYVRFPLAERQGTADAGVLARLGHRDGAWAGERPALVVWTTTPWTLTANTAVAVAPREEYVLVGGPGGERLLLAAALVESVVGDGWTVVERFTGAELEGVFYDPPYPHAEAGDGWYRVLPADYVTTGDGTGFVHIAPAYGAEDAELAKAHGFETRHTVDPRGILQEGFPGGGKFVKQADDDLIADLDARGLLLRRETIHHTYPFCWRCGTPLLYYAKNTWYIQTTAKKDELLAANQAINWYPEHIKEGRFGEWLRNNVDWAVSRERYWGTPLPIWRCDGCGHASCIGGEAELAEHATPETAGLLDGLDLHRPFVDRVELVCPQCGGAMKRVPEVLDAWYDSGAMPFAQWAYPVTVDGPGGAPLTLDGPRALIDSPLFPADYITEAVDQTRGWFYSLLALSTLITGGSPYRNCIVLGLILDGNGEKMSKSKGNVVDPWEVIRAHGADALRWSLFTAAPAGVARRFSADLVQETVRRFLLTLWNTYSFFVTYANIDGFDPDAHASFWSGPVGGPALAEAPPAELDRWIVSELNDLVREVGEQLDAYNPTDAGRRIEEFVDGLSNWYVRRSRRRFWKPVRGSVEGPESDEDKTWAYVTLYSCLSTLSRLMAPLTPFVADAMFKNLAPAGSPESVHLADFPEAEPALVDERLERAVRLAMRVASLGRAARAKSGIKVRQPLARVLVRLRPDEVELLPLVQTQILDELNVKAVEGVSEEDLVTLRVRPNLPVLGPKYGDRMGAVRAAIEAADAAELAAASRGGTVTVGGFELGSGDLLVDAEDRPGLVSAAEAPGGLIVAVDTTLTPELEAEGLVRELVHRIQNMRKAAGFEIEDRIVTYVDGATAAFAAVLAAHDAYVRAETLSEAVHTGPAPAGAHVERQDVEGVGLTLGVQRA